PVVTLLVLIASNKVKAHIAAIVALIVANAVAIIIFTMPADMSLRATVLGAVTGFFPIGWIVLNVIFMYRLTVATGRFKTLQQAIGGGTADRRPPPLLIAVSFRAFFEGASGVRTPAAPTAADLLRLRLSPPPRRWRPGGSRGSPPRRRAHMARSARRSRALPASPNSILTCSAPWSAASCRSSR